jgi:hypothetical protein
MVHCGAYDVVIFQECDRDANMEEPHLPMDNLMHVFDPEDNSVFMEN